MSDTTSLEEMHVLANSIRRTYNRLLHATDQIHAELELSAPKRTLLMDLSREGPMTVPMVAAARYVSRQIIQTQVNELIELGLLATKHNPEHKRSSLVTLTAKARKLVQQMKQEEQRFMEQIGWLPERAELSSCIQVLDAIYDKLEEK
jgi:DNA-binding MarR family transcriptional regulator